MNEQFNKKLLNMISNMNDEELECNLKKASKYLGNVDTDALLKKIKDIKSNREE